MRNWKANSKGQFYPKISIIVPVYNTEKYLEQCARSLFEQTLDGLEYIFVDDGSSDASLTVLQKVIDMYPERKACVKIITQNSNNGVSCSRNAGLDIAQGKFVAFCDSDDWVSPDMYEKLYCKATEINADIVYCDYVMYYGNNDERVYETIATSDDKIAFLRNYMSSFTGMCNMLIRREMIVKYNLRFPSDIAYREDFHLGFRLYYYAKTIEKISSPLYFYNRINENSALHKRYTCHSDDELQCGLDIISFLIKENAIDPYKDILSWGVLEHKQYMIWDKRKHETFLKIYPESHRYIWGCPSISKKMKCLMWLLVHHFNACVYLVVSVRNFLKS